MGGHEFAEEFRVVIPQNVYAVKIGGVVSPPISATGLVVLP